MITLEQIVQQFPFKSPRPGQIECIEFILNNFASGKKYVILEVPCGGGKSAIALTVANFFESTYMLTITKILQDQLVGEFGENGKLGNQLVDLKGRNSYECPYYRANAEKMRASKLISHQQYVRYRDEYFDCAEGHCRLKGKYRHEECISGNFCPYYVQKDKAMASKICLMNFAGFLAQTNFTQSFGKRSLLIVDECHNIEPQLLDFVSMTLNDHEFEGLKFPELDTAEEYAEWLEKSGAILILEKKAFQAKCADDPKKADELESLKQKIRWFLEEMREEDHDQWICEYQETDRGHRLVFKPIYVRKHVKKYLFEIADHVLMMSATILNANVMCNSLGIEKKDLAAKRLGSRFPVENRPIYYKPAVKVTGGKSQQHVWGPRLVDAVTEIVQKYSGQKGIIHTHNFAIAQMIMDETDPGIGRRFLFQKNFPNKQEMLEVHARSQDTIIVAPAMHEGLDLSDDLSRFQIICKVPFPNFYEDKQLAARKDVDSLYYDWLTALKLVQSVGRSIRSATDWAHTYVIDEAFKWWYRDNQNMLPIWFKEAVKGI